MSRFFQSDLRFAHGVGRHKAATSHVFLSLGDGTIKVNNRPLKHYLQLNDDYIDEVEAPLKLFSVKYHAVVKVSGGGIGGQAKAIRLAIARALVNWCRIEGRDSLAVERKKRLKFFGYLTRDSRSKERKKYGLRKARKAPQFSKR